MVAKSFEALDNICDAHLAHRLPSVLTFYCHREEWSDICKWMIGLTLTTPDQQRDIQTEMWRMMYRGFEVNYLLMP